MPEAFVRAGAAWEAGARGHADARNGGVRLGGALSAAWLALVLTLAGCVSDGGSGGMRPASRQERVQAHLDLARGYIETGQLQRARGPLQRALEIDPRSADGHNLMGWFYQLQGETERAEEHFQRALRSDPDSARVHNNYGVLLYQEGRYEEALEQLREATSDPDYSGRASAYENLGLVALEVGDRTLARNAFNRAVMLNDRQPRALLELAELAYEDGDYVQSRAYYDRFRELADQTARSLWLGIRLARRGGDEDTVASYGLQLKNMYPGSPEHRRYQESRDDD